MNFFSKILASILAWFKRPPTKEILPLIPLEIPPPVVMPPRPDSQNTIDKIPSDQIMGGITFSILKTGNVHINCEWSAGMIPQAYGELLYQINEGELTNEIVSILMSHVRSDPQDLEIVSEIVEYWRIMKEHMENQPVISPSNVFSIERLQGQMNNNHMDEMGGMDDMDDMDDMHDIEGMG